MATINVRSPGHDVTQYEGWASYALQGNPQTLRLYTDANQRIRVPFALLVPGRTYTVTARLLAYGVGGAKVYGVLNGQSRELPSVWTVATWTMTGDRPQTLEIAGLNNVLVHYITITSTVPDKPRRPLPGDELSLEVLTPRPGAQPFTLNSSRLGRDALTRRTVWPGTLQLGTGKLGQTNLAAPDLLDWWQPVLGKARAVATRRGSTGTLVPVAQVGTLTAEFPNALDPRAHGIRKGTPLRLYHWPSRTLLWSGTVDRATVQPERPGRRLRYTTTLEAVDTVDTLARTDRYGAIPEGSESTGGIGRSESWQDRAARLMASAPAVRWRVAPAAPGSLAPPAMGATVLESSLAKHLDVLAASAAGCWWVDPDGTVVLCPGTPAGEDAALFTDTGSAAAHAWPYVDAAASWDSSELATVVEVKNYRAEWDSEQGDWSDASLEVTAENPTLVATYGRNSQSIESNLYDPSGEASLQLGIRLARGQDSEAPVSAVALDALPRMDRAAALNLFTPATATLRGETRAALISAISHTITPHAWRCQVGLLERNSHGAA